MSRWLMGSSKIRKVQPCATSVAKLQARAFAKGKFTRRAQGNITFEEEVMQEVARLRLVEWGDAIGWFAGR